MTELSRSDLVIALCCAMVDRLSANTSRRFEEAGIDHILLKGPAFGRWLYGPDELRPYQDSDFMVPHERWDDAVALLHANGFEDALGLTHPGMQSYTSHPWRGPGGDVDLHATLEGLEADMGTVWEVLRAHTEPLEVDGREIPVLARPALRMHVALHAAHHHAGNPLIDLDRALARDTDDDWAASARLAADLGGTAAFVSGLRTHEEGRLLVERLALGHVSSTKTFLRASGVPVAEGLFEVTRAPGLAKKAELLFRELVPSPDFMRWWLPLARRGRVGLALAYLWRPLWLLSRMPAAVRVLWKARRQTS